MAVRSIAFRVINRRSVNYQNCPKKRLLPAVCLAERLLSSAAESLKRVENSGGYVTIKDNILHASAEDFKIPDVSLCEYLFPYLEKYGQKPYLIDGITGKSYSFHDCLLLCQKVASGLTKLGLKKGDVVGIYAANSPEYVIAWLAVMMTGAITTEVNPLSTAGELKHLLQFSKASFLISDEGNSSAARETLQNFPQIKKAFVFGKAEGFIPFEELMRDNGDALKNIVQVDPNSLAHLPYSSGTTGLPKGVMIPHKGVVGSTYGSSFDNWKVSQYDELCIILVPLYHIYGNYKLCCNTVAGTTTVFLPRFTPESLLSTIQKYRAVYVPLVPPLVMFLLQSPLVREYDLSSLKKVMCGAAPVSTAYLEQLKEKFNLTFVRQGYGMSEVCPIAIHNEILTSHLDCVGHIIPGVDLKVVNISNGQTQKLGESGEICVKADFQMLGYLNNPEATAATIDADGWLHTGDIGHLDEKYNLFVVDRLKEVIKFKGHQVAPAELESLLLSHPDVLDSAVIGIPDERAGEVPRAYVVLKQSAKNTTEKDIQKFVASQTSDEKHLRGGVVFTDQIPKSASGKILRKDLKKLFLQK